MAAYDESTGEPAPRNPRLTRIEVVVGVTVIVVVGGILTVGIGRLRETAGLKSCENNLRQLGLAVMNYDSACGRLPCRTDAEAEPPESRPLRSAFARLLPYIEASPYGFHENMEVERYNGHSARTWTFPSKIPGEMVTQHGGTVNILWRTFLDPGDSTAKDLRDVEMKLPDGSTGYYATGSYALNGLAPWGTGSLDKSFPRGPANAVLISERPQVCQTESGDKIYNLWGLGFYSPHMPTFATLTPADLPPSFSTGQVAPILPLPKEEDANREADLRVRIGSATAPPRAPDFATPLQRILPNAPCDPRLPGGPHAGGLLCGMADSSVRTFSWTTSPWVFWDACTPDADEGKR